MVVWGQLCAILSMLGVCARAIAFPSLRGLMPQPSITIKTNGRGRPEERVLIANIYSIVRFFSDSFVQTAI